MTITEPTFSASEAALLSGASGSMQRVWRKRGFIRKAEGHARHTLTEVIEMRLMVVLSARGCRLLRAVDLSREIAEKVVEAIRFDTAIPVYVVFRSDSYSGLAWEDMEIEWVDNASDLLDEVSAGIVFINIATIVTSLRDALRMGRKVKR